MRGALGRRRAGPHEDATVSEQPHSGSASERSAPPSMGARLRGLIKRPGVWALGIAGTVATGYVTASLNDLTKSVGGYVSELSCQWRKPSPAPDEPKFTILVAKLYKDDGEDTHTRRVFETFQGERGFRPVLLCGHAQVRLPAGGRNQASRGNHNQSWARSHRPAQGGPLDFRRGASRRQFHPHLRHQ